MPPRKDVDAAASVPAFYGAELRWKRENAGLTLQELAEGCFYSVAFLSQIEMGDRRMPLDLARHADQLLDTDGFFERRCDDARKAKQSGHAEYFADVVEQEKRARTIDEWAPTLIPGLLQTDAYARAVVRAQYPLDLSEDVDKKVAARLERAVVFDEPKRPEYWVILHELLLHQPIMESGAMAEQFEHIAALARRGRVITQVLPLNAGAHPFMIGSVMLMTFDDAPALAYTESLHSGQTIDDLALVKKYTKSYDLLRAAASPPRASLTMIEAAAEDYANDDSR
ncbi:helix-turn-helix domain-containing protein [Streptomyces bathyalis]|uniref:Helix-turn-helix domain-containing protein n=1 Tax=Streptomyces bathyalis TaxID=2710756 RepID=A0A7T1WSW6_9ACTN|nr:helix-turn-helix transcriptional regulator [Streptomyces bathyalis]QPP07991.1 helix-turn-helix domain-containing protein [Streptomyces bathyalis]